MFCIVSGIHFGVDVGRVALGEQHLLVVKDVASFSDGVEVLGVWPVLRDAFWEEDGGRLYLPPLCGKIKQANMKRYIANILISALESV